MITIVNNHRQAHAKLRATAGHLRILTRQMLAEGVRLGAHDDIAIIYADESYALHGVVNGVLDGVLEVIRVMPRPGICAICGRIEPCDHSRRA